MASLTREQVLAALDLYAQELQRLGAKSLALFGSVARGEGSESSDIKPRLRSVILGEAVPASRR